MIHPSWNYGEHEHNHYQKHGYFIFDRFLTDEALTVIQGHVNRMIGQLPEDQSPEGIMNPHMFGEQWFWDLGTEPRLLDMVERHIGPNIVLWSASILAKPPRTGRPIRWHQDAPYWNISGPFAGGIWIALDNVTEKNGTMSLLPRWHTKGTLPKVIHDDVFFNEEIDPASMPDDTGSYKLTYNLKAGQMGVHDTMLPHASTPNQSDGWRRIISYRYMAAEGTIAEQTYQSYLDGSPYPRTYYLVRGKDVHGYGLPGHPEGLPPGCPSSSSPVA